MGKINIINNILNNTPAISKIKLPQTKALSPTITPNIQDKFEKSCECIAHFDDSKCVVFGDFPNNYVTIEKFFIEAQPERISKFTKKVIPAQAAKWEITQYLKPSYFISHLFSHARGQGTSAVQQVVRKSLDDIRTQGRVTLQADIIDGKTSPAGFYYKLGFRFPNKNDNDILQKWIENGGNKKNAPMLTGMMYLPEENIMHCLNY